VIKDFVNFIVYPRIINKLFVGEFLSKVDSVVVSLICFNLLNINMKEKPGKVK